MKGKVGRLLDVAMSVADGSALGWHEIEAESSDSNDLAVLNQLRIVARIAEVHKSQAADSVLTDDAPVRWGPFLLLRQLGDGAFGDVYLARDTQLDRLVAIKLLRPRDESDRWLVHSMLREARALAKVRHPNVVTVYGAEARDGCVGLSMEFVTGSTIEQLLQASGPFSALDAGLIGQELCKALAAVHAADLVHGDVKAQNVMREEGGRVVLMDFGSGQRRHEAAGEAQRLTGTPLYVAPEVLAGERASVPSDIYSAGVLLYHLVTNRYPIDASDLGGVRDAHKHGRTVKLQDARPDLPANFTRIVERAIARDPLRRYETADALRADLAEAFGQTIDPMDSSATRGASTRRAGPARVFDLRRGLWLGSFILMVLALAAVGVTVSRSAQTTAVGTSPVIQSIAVLPLANLSGNPADAYMIDGWTDELIATLGRVPSLRITSWTSVVPFRVRTRPVREIGRALNVDAVLEGSVTLVDATSATPGSSRHVRVTTRLIHAGTDTLVWSRSFDRELADALGLQHEIAGDIAREIRAGLTPIDRGKLAQPPATNAAARDAYLHGRYLLDQYERSSLEKALQFLKQAVTIDPGYAVAWSALSRCYVMLELAVALPRSEARALAMAAVTRALELDETLPSAHGNLAELDFYYDWDWAAAERGYQRALELNPSDSASRADYARLLAAEGRLSDALQQAQRARELDPLSPYATSTVGMMFYYARQYSAAIGELERAIRFAPPTAPRYLALGRAYTEQGMFVEALPALQRAVQLSSEAPDTVAELARALALSGDRSEALDLLGRIGRVGTWTPESLTYVYAALGDRDQVMDLLNQAIVERAPRVLWAKVDPRLDPVRSDPRFAQIVQQLGNP